MDGLFFCLFWTPNTDLDPAQAAKLEHICRKLHLKPGERLLDIGCGWGGLELYAAQNYGVQATGITLSQPQVTYAREWIKRAGLSDRVLVDPWDYRETEADKPFDKIASVGRAKLSENFQAAYRVLRPGGLFLNQAIATHRLRPGRQPQTSSCTQRRTDLSNRAIIMAASVQRFERGGINVYQVLLAKCEDGKAGLPLTRDALYHR